MSVFYGFDSESHVRAMKQMGVDVSFVYPTYGLWLLAVDTMAPHLIKLDDNKATPSCQLYRLYFTDLLSF